jgi:hypothetical protein
MPVFVRAGAAIPRYVAPPQHLKGPAAAALALDLYAGAGRRRLHFAEGAPLAIDYTFTAEHSLLRIAPAPITLTVRLIGWSAAAQVVEADW